jgi:hypothetical protein
MPMLSWTIVVTDANHRSRTYHIQAVSEVEAIRALMVG